MYFGAVWPLDPAGASRAGTFAVGDDSNFVCLQLYIEVNSIPASDQAGFDDSEIRDGRQRVRLRGR